MSTVDEQGQAVRPAIGVLGPYTHRAVERLKQGKPGDRIDRMQMAAVIGRDCNPGTNGDGNVRSAIERVKKDYHIWWEWSREQQVWICLDEGQKVDSQTRQLRLVRRRTRRHARASTTITMDTLDVTQKQEHLLNQTMFLMAQTATDTHFRKRLAGSGTLEKLQQPSTAKLLELMQDGKGP